MRTPSYPDDLKFIQPYVEEYAPLFLFTMRRKYLRSSRIECEKLIHVAETLLRDPALLEKIDEFEQELRRNGHWLTARKINCFVAGIMPRKL